MRSLALTLFNGLGDGLLARPALKALRRYWERVDLYCYDNGAHAVFGGLGLHIHPRSSSDFSVPIGQEPRLWISFNAYDPIPMEEPFGRSWRGLDRRGFHPGRGKSFEETSRIPMRNAYLQVAGLPGRCVPTDAPPFLQLRDRQRARRWLGERQRPICLLHGDSLADKCWPVENWRIVASELSRRGYILIACGQNPAIWHSVADVRPAWPALDLAAQFALVNETSLFVGIDSVFMHAADAFDKCGVVLFGPGDPVVWGPASPRLRVLGGLAPMPTIRPTDVLAAVDDVQWSREAP